ncbi:MAG: patatin [Firmicutes bacterium]|nr:patatin [Bacillota bacterium]
MSKYKIITFDGGGIRGALSVSLFLRLTKYFPQLISETDMFSGTSTGSFIALTLAHGLPVEELVNLYTEKKAKYVFSQKHLFLFKPKYSNKHLRNVLQSVFPVNLRLRDLKHHVVIPSFLVDGGSSSRWEPVMFNNLPGSSTRNERVIDVALASSAAPVYFPSYQNFIDGGVIANNPSLAALSAAVDRRSGRQKLENVFLLSIGNGYAPQKIPKGTHGWGAMQWTIGPNPSLPLLSILFEGDVEADTLFTSQILANQYYRLNPQVKDVIQLDDYTRIPELLKLAKGYDLNEVVSWLEKNWF